MTDTPMARAAEHLQAGRYLQAIGAYQAVLGFAPEAYEAHIRIAEAEAGRGNPEAAVETLLQAANRYAETENHFGALALFGQALARDPARLEVHLDVAICESATGHHDAAIKRCKALAETYLRAGRHEEAEEIFRFVAGWESSDVAVVPSAPLRLALRASGPIVVAASRDGASAEGPSAAVGKRPAPKQVDPWATWNDDPRAGSGGTLIVRAPQDFLERLDRTMVTPAPDAAQAAPSAERPVASVSKPDTAPVRPAPRPPAANRSPRRGSGSRVQLSTTGKQTATKKRHKVVTKAPTSNKAGLLATGLPKTGASKDKHDSLVDRLRKRAGLDLLKRPFAKRASPPPTEPDLDANTVKLKPPKAPRSLAPSRLIQVQPHLDVMTTAVHARRIPRDGLEDITARFAAPPKIVEDDQATKVFYSAADDSGTAPADPVSCDGMELRPTLPR